MIWYLDMLQASSCKRLTLYVLDNFWKWIRNTLSSTDNIECGFLVVSLSERSYLHRVDSQLSACTIQAIGYEFFFYPKSAALIKRSESNQGVNTFSRIL